MATRAPRANGAETRRAGKTHEPDIVLLESRLHPPAPRPESVPRERLIASLIRAADNKLILVDAPIGYGKTTLLAQWQASQAEARPFAWVSLDSTDDDPLHLWTYIVEALARVVPLLGDRNLPLLANEPKRFEKAVVPRLIKQLAVLPRRVVLVLDDYQHIRNESCHASLGQLIASLPPSAQIVISTRSDPPIQLSRRVPNAMMEVRAPQLRFDRQEASLLLRRTVGHEIADSQVERLVDRTEGWPAGLYLAALSLREHTDSAEFVEQFTGDNHHVVDYLTLDVLDKQPKSMRRFLVRTSILDRLTASLCDTVVGNAGSEAMLDDLSRSNLLLVPLDDKTEWYRYHLLFKELLRSELQRSEPDLVPELHRRASAWHRNWGFLEEAIAHAIAAGDIPAARDLIDANWFPYWEAGRIEDVRGWLAALGSDGVASDPLLVLVAAWTTGLLDRRDEFDEWLTLAERLQLEGSLHDGKESLEAEFALIRTLFGREGVGASLEAARRAVTLEGRSTARGRPDALTSWGFFLYMSGDRRGAAEALEQARSLGGGAETSMVLALAELSMIAGEEGRRPDPLKLAREARALVQVLNLGDDPLAAPEYAATGLVLSTTRNAAAARADLERALELGRKAPWMQPWLTLQVIVALAPVRSAQGDADGARELIREASSILEANPDAGVFPDRLVALEALLAGGKASAVGEPLTERELAVLSLLPSSMTQREIGGRLYLSINTVKSHTRSIFRKLGVGSRAQAVAKAQDLGLL